MKKWLLALAVSAGLVGVLPGSARAEGDSAEDPNTGGISVTAGIDYTTAYYFRGYNQEDSRFIVQPYATLSFNLLDSDALDLNAYVGTWSSLHAQQSAGDDNIYETDYYGGIDLSFGENVPVTLGLIYTVYTFPGDAFESVQEIGAKLTYDDSSFMERMNIPFALKPYVGVYKEISDRNAEVLDEGEPGIFANDGSQDIYMELGIGPTFNLGQTPFGNVTLGVPVILGTSLDGYYADDSGSNEFLGYGSVGVTASVPLPMPARYGAWTLTAGVSYLHLFADSVEDLNSSAEEGGIGGDKEESAIIGKVGVSFTY